MFLNPTFLEIPFSSFISLRECQLSTVAGKAGARWESMRLLAESLMKASLLSGRPSWSRARRRHLVIQAMLRSTTHLLGRTWKPAEEDVVFGLGSVVLASEAVPRRCTV